MSIIIQFVKNPCSKNQKEKEDLRKFRSDNSDPWEIKSPRKGAVRDVNEAIDNVITPNSSVLYPFTHSFNIH